MNTEPKFIHVIADYGQLGDLAFAEVANKLHVEIKKAKVTNYHMQLTSVPAFDTYATGFVLAQLAINSELGKDHYFYVNTAPRKDNKSARKNNAGEGLVYAKLKNGVQIVAVNSGHSLTLVKPFAEEIRVLHVENDGSQFRSRDKFPVALGAILAGDKLVIGEDVRHTVDDNLPKNRVIYTDGYGNLKCSIDPAELEKDKGKRVHVHIEGSKEQIPIEVGASIFSVPDGEYCFAKGSSGWKTANGLTVAFAEIIKRGGSASEAFGRPEGGALVEWRPVPR